MALELMDEHEQSELVRSWLRRNLNAIVFGVLGGIGLIVAWHQWQAMKVDHGAKAQDAYRSLVEALERKDAAAAEPLFASLRADYDDTGYAAFAALREAQFAIDQGKPDEALEALEWARSKASLPELRDVASLRLARLKLAQGDAQAALTLAEGVKSPGFAGVSAELRGDALRALDRAADALGAYDEALAALDVTSPQRATVQMKRDDLAVAKVGS